MTKQDAEKWVGAGLVEVLWSNPVDGEEEGAAGEISSIDDEYIHLDWGYSIRIDSPGLFIQECRYAPK